MLKKRWSFTALFWGINEMRQARIFIDKFVDVTFRNRERSVNRHGTPLCSRNVTPQNKGNTRIRFVNIVSDGVCRFKVDIGHVNIRPDCRQVVLSKNCWRICEELRNHFAPCCI